MWDRGKVEALFVLNNAFMRARYSSLPEAASNAIIKENKMELKKLMEYISLSPDYRHRKSEHKLSEAVLFLVNWGSRFWGNTSRFFTIW